MITVLAEKPSVGRELASVMGGSKKGDSYLEGNGYIFTWCIGHLVGLAMPEDYGFDWKMGELPMIPEKFKLMPRQLKDRGKSGNDPSVMRQLTIIKECFSRSTEIIVATDAGREGELIFRHVYDFLKCKLPFKRLWISSLTDSAIREGFKNLRNGKEYDSLYYAARSRAESDWLVGLNATQALSRRCRALYSLGRVQTPTLVLICQRYLDNKNFVKTKFYKLCADVFKARSFSVESVNQWPSRATVPSIVSKEGKVLAVDVKAVTKKAPRLHDLTSLQKMANQKFSMTADKTLEIAQSLYEKKYITYPRTGSQFLTQDVFDQLPRYVKALPENLRSLLPAHFNKSVVNADKVTDHHAIICTENKFNGSGEEKDIYDLVISRMVEALCEDAKANTTKVKILIDREEFVVSSLQYTYMGWKTVKGLVKESEEDEEENMAILPSLVVGDLVRVEKMEVREGETKPLPMYTDSTILSAMETAGKLVANDDEKDAMKDCGLGTPATRAGILDTLVKREYISRQKKSLVPSEKGLFVYEIMKDKALGKADMTGNWEKRLNDIYTKGENHQAFMSGIVDYTCETVHDLLAVKNVMNTKVAGGEVVKAPCPSCGKPLKFVKNDKMDALLCSDQARECRFILWRTVAKKKLADKDLLALAGDKARTGLIRGFSGKNGKFEAFLKRTGEKVAFVFNQG